MSFEFSVNESAKKTPHMVDNGDVGDAHRQACEQCGKLSHVGYLDTIKVRNVEDTSDEDSHFEHEWSGFWQDKTWLAFPSKCANIGCENEAPSPDIVGAHVRKEGEPNNDRNAWIVPLCKSCNSSENKSEMELSIGTWMARVVMSKAHKTVEASKSKV